MSDYTNCNFVLPQHTELKAVKKFLNKHWDAFTIKELNNEDSLYQLTIHELSLKESYNIMYKISRKFQISLVVTYGVYYYE